MTALETMEGEETLAAIGYLLSLAIMRYILHFRAYFRLPAFSNISHAAMFTFSSSFLEFLMQS